VYIERSGGVNRNHAQLFIKRGLNLSKSRLIRGVLKKDYSFVRKQKIVFRFSLPEAKAFQRPNSETLFPSVSAKTGGFFMKLFNTECLIILELSTEKQG